ncbi:MAG: RMD1 family protein, partial [Bacteroidota bacterium]
MIDLDAHLVADELPIRRIRSDFKGSLVSETSTELFYTYKEGHVILFNYGVVVFANIDPVDQTNFIAMLRQFVPKALEISEYREDFSIQISKEIERTVFDYNQMIVPYLDEDILRLTMLQVAQSTALDYYQASAQSLLDASTEIVGQLERSGALHISKRKLLQFIGKTMNTKNRIFDNLYVLDSPPQVWESEFLGKIN